MRRALACLCVVLASAWAFAPVAHNGFVNYDDPKYLTENPVVQRGLTLDGLAWAFHNRQTANFHPLTWLSHMLDVELFGLDPAAHHLVSLGLHALAACCLCLALAALGLSLATALLVALFFALHPLRVESVAWAAERKDVLASLFFALTLLAWAAWARRGRRLGYALAWLAFLLGLFAKSMLVTLPAVLLLLDVWPLARVRSLGWRRLLLEKLPFAALALACAGLTLFTQRAAGAVRDTEHVAPLARVANALHAIGAYLAQSLVPHGLTVFYPHPAIVRPEASPWSAPVLVALVGVALLSALAWRARKRAPALLVGWLWFLGMLVPVLGLVQVGEQARADRYTYLPSIGLALGLIGALDALSRTRPALRRALVAAAAVALALCALRTRAQARLWHDSETLFRHALAVDQRNDVAWLALAQLDLERGELEPARERYERVLAIRPDSARAHNGLGIVLQRLGRSAEARASFERALEQDPDDALAANNLGIACARAGESQRALELFERALRLRPDFGEALRNRGGVLFGLGRLPEALQAFERAEQSIGPDARLSEDRARVHQALGQNGRAAELYARALELAGDGPPPLGAAGPLAWILATDPDAALRDGPRAVRLAQACVAATRERDPRLLATLAAAHAESGSFEQALRFQELAIQRAGSAGGDLGRALESYREGRPWRERR